MAKIYKNKEDMIEDYKDYRKEVMQDLIKSNNDIEKEKKEKKILIIIISCFILILIAIGTFFTIERFFPDDDHVAIKQTILDCISKGKIEFHDNAAIIKMEDLYLSKCGNSEFYFKNKLQYQCLGYVTVKREENNQYIINTDNYCNDYIE